MAKRNEQVYNLPTLDDILTTQEERDEANLEKIVEIPIEELVDFHSNELGRQPYRVDERTESFKRLFDSISSVGFLQPAIVREDKEYPYMYEVVAGMRRKRVGELLHAETIPCVIRQMDDDTANIIVTDANEYRDDEEILPSEKAWAYRIRLDAMKRQAGRPSKNNLVPVGQNFSRKELALQTGESQTQIQRYIRLTYLIPDIMNMVDDKEIALRPAVEISYLPEESQEELLDAMLAEDCTPSHAQTLRMRQLLEAGELTREAIYDIMTEEKPNQKEKITIQADRVGKYIPKAVPMEKREEYIIKALECYSPEKVDRHIPKNIPKEKRQEYIAKALEYYGRYRQKQREKQEKDAR